jgi:prolyl 4-hydroxylase
MCHTCEYLSIEGRCPIDPDAPKAWGPGGLDKMFTKLTTEPYLSEYEVEILSSPSTTGGPWVITMENVVSEEAVVALMELGATEGYKRSADVGKLRADGSHEDKVNDGRTSTNAWCQHECYESDMGQKVAHRLSNLTDIPEPNSEYLQLLRYEPGQHYQVHHDYIGHHLKRYDRMCVCLYIFLLLPMTFVQLTRSPYVYALVCSCLSRQQGVRMLTLYLYLNDVEAGGGTNFEKLDITVMPKRGRALLWPSVFDDNPDKKDSRTTHQALPTEAGIKYGANAWFHMHNFKASHAESCH